MVTGRRLILPNRCSTAVTIRSRTVLAADAARGGEEAHGLAITAVQCEGDPHLLTIVAANLEAIGAPTAVAFIYCNPTVVPPLNAANVAIEQEAVHLDYTR